MQRADGSLYIAERHGCLIDSYYIAQGDSNDCGPHVVAMAINFWQGSTVVQADVVAREMNRPRLGTGLPPLVVRRIPNWATFPWGIVDELKTHGVQARWRLRATEDDLQRALREDRVAMPIFGEPLLRKGWRWVGWSHVAILSGWDPAAQVYYFVDSAQDNAPSTRPRDEFMTYWSNMGRILVETV
jgi:hypothetical protein